MSPYKDKELLNKAKRTKGFIGFPPGYFIIGLPLDKNSFENYEDRFYIFYNGTEDYDVDIFKMHGRENVPKLIESMELIKSFVKGEEDMVVERQREHSTEPFYTEFQANPDN